ncbi:hypothetical protein C0J52_09030 [Blattella germanica]|nr:hypothetical protein C0J52_09030 [Blattella germanica]
MGVDNTPMALDQHHPPPQPPPQQQQQSVFSMNGHNSNQSMPGTPPHTRSAPNSPDPISAIDSAKAAANAAHINGTSSLPTSCASASPHSVGNLLTSAAAAAAAAQPTSALPQLLAAPQPAAMPQFILASGQLVQGIQGAQLLIPTSQGIATQTILTIPVNHVTSGQMVNLALSNGQVVTTTLANLQTLAQPHHLLAPASAAAAAAAAAAANTAVPSPSPTLGPGLNLNQAATASLPHLLTNGNSAVQQHQQLLNAMQQPQLVTPQPSLMTPTAQPNSTPNQPTINQTNSNVVDGINLDEIKEFAKAFKLRRLSLGLTQTQVGQALSITEGPAYSQSAICRFEKLDITPKSAQKIKPVLEMWMKEAEERYKSGQNHLTEFIGVEPSKKRKRRTSFTPQALELLNAHFERNTHPSGTEITALAHQLGYEREVIRIWFCNKRQALKNTVRMMSKGVA